MARGNYAAALRAAGSAGAISQIAALKTQVAGVASSMVPYGLAAGKGTCVVPIGQNCNLIGNISSTGTDTSTTYRTFVSLSDPKAGAVLPGYNNNPNPTNFVGDNPAPNAILIAAAVELSDGTVMPFTFNGAHTVTIPAAGGQIVFPDNPIAIGAQVTDATLGKGVIFRTYVSTPTPGRTDSASTTSGSPTVTDASITAADLGRRVTGTGIPNNSYVGTVTPGVSFLLSTRTDSQVNANANATGTPTITIQSIWPLNYGTLTTANSLSRSNGTNGADLTLETSAGGAAGFTTNANQYGPCVVLGPAPTARKPIVLTMSDSIFNGASDSFVGPTPRAAIALGLPHVKMSKVAETAVAVSTPAGRKYRAQLIPGTTHAIVEYGTNDGVTSAGQVTAIKNALIAIGAYLDGMGIKTVIVTAPPKSTSSVDGFATTAGQTTFNVPAQLASLNSQIRAGLGSWQIGYIDMHDIVASGRDTGLWAQHPLARQVTDAATTSGSNVVTSASAAFTAADIGLGIFVAGGHSGGIINGVTNATTVTVTTTLGGANANASATVSGAIGGIGAFYATGDGTHPTATFYNGLTVAGYAPASSLKSATQTAMAAFTL